MTTTVGTILVNGGASGLGAATVSAVSAARNSSAYRSSSAGTASPRAVQRPRGVPSSTVRP